MANLVLPFATHSHNTTKALPELGHKAAGLGSPYKHLVDFLNHSSVIDVYSHSKTLWLMRNKSCTNVLKLVLLLSFVHLRCPGSLW